MEQIVYVINNENYIIIEELIINDKSANKIELSCKKYNCIPQGIKEIGRSFFLKSYIIVKILVPEKNINAYAAESYNS